MPYISMFAGYNYYEPYQQYTTRVFKICFMALLTEQSPADQLVPTILVEIMTNITPENWIPITGEITSCVKKVIAKNNSSIR